MLKRTNLTRTSIQRIAFAGLTASALVATPAFATPIVSTWTYDITTVFDTTQTDFTSGTGSTTNAEHLLKWGIPANNNPNNKQSALEIEPFSGSSRTVSTYTGTGTPGASFISDPNIRLNHHNFVIKSASSMLQSAVLTNSITLTPDADSALTAIDLSFGIDFFETFNSTPCVVHGTNCADIFVIDQNSLNHTFDYEGHSYFLSMFPVIDGSVLGTLPDDVCEAASAATGCFGFTTLENKINTMEFGLTISTEKLVTSVPAPSVLFLLTFGLALIGAASVVRRRNHGA